jgi:hypothetical protein
LQGTAVVVRFDLQAFLEALRSLEQDAGAFDAVGDWTQAPAARWLVRLN